MRALEDRLVVSPEVQDALEGGRAVVALESTILAHGFPKTESLQLGQRLEQIVRAEGAVPATIAILDGQIKVGLDEDELARVALEDNFEKCSSRDLGLVVARGGCGATTVAATTLLAELAAIDVFATGGVGGVHRGAHLNFDVSADLDQMARSQVAVVSAGAKAILDLGLTLEVLETLGVPVIGYQTSDFPAFYCRESGHKLPQRADDVPTLAQAIHIHWSLQGCGVLVCNPIPHSAALDRAQVEGWISAALEEAARQGVNGKAVTPFLLAALRDLSADQSLAANAALVENNARLAAKLAVALRLT
jgi:pseudouridine-5'-phosphate glycosidase